MLSSVETLSIVKPFFFLSTTLGWNESHIVRFLCFCGCSMHVAQAPVSTYRWMPEDDAGCPVFIILHFIPLRQGLLLNPELGRRLASSTTTLASSLHSARVIDVCVAFYIGAEESSLGSHAYTASALAHWSSCQPLLCIVVVHHVFYLPYLALAGLSFTLVITGHRFVHPFML